jgi:PKD repeat protein
VLDITSPIAEAGPDQTVDEGETVTFDGSGSSDNVGIINWAWTFEYGSDEITLNGISPSFTFDIPGIYTIRLNTSDAAGQWHEDSMTVTVRDITPPITNAGDDQTVPAGTTVTLNGSRSTDNGKIKSYSWTFIYDDEEQNLEGEVVSFTFDISGFYSIRLNVSDAAGYWHEDTVTITVRDITAPIVNAGDDQTVPVGTTITLNGSLSTDNGLIKSYSWTFIYDDEEQNLEGEVVSFTFDEKGVYEILLTVRDEFDNIGEGSVTITVEEVGDPGEVESVKGDDKEELSVVLFVILGVLILLIIVIVLFFRMKKKGNGSGEIESDEDQLMENQEKKVNPTERE